jgi:hypothetical protein
MDWPQDQPGPPKTAILMNGNSPRRAMRNSTMSYDLNVYAKQRLDLDTLFALIRKVPGFDVEQTDGRYFTIEVVRGTRAIPTFALDAPVDVEAENIPTDVVSQAIGLAVLYEIHASVSDGSALAGVVRFAKSLALAAGGVMYDPQTEAVWPRSTNRRAQRVTGSDRIDMVELTWYTAHNGDHLARRFLTEARRHLPEALPRRFGTYEPLQGRLERDGDDAFIEEAAGAHSVYSKGKYPVIHGGIAGSTALGAPLSRLHLSIPRPVLGLPDWRAAIEAFFMAIACDALTVFAYGEVVRNVGWSGQSNWYDQKVEKSHSLVLTRRGWMGLHPYPVWMTYFGHDYADLVRDQLGEDAIEQPFGGVLKKWSPDPMDRDALAMKIAAQRANGSDSGPWLPEKLLGRLPPPDGGWGQLLDYAQTIPPTLRNT